MRVSVLHGRLGLNVEVVVLANAQWQEPRLAPVELVGVSPDAGSGANG